MTARGRRKIEGSREFGAEIRAIRKRLGMSLVELADKADLSPSHLSEIETGKTTNPGIAVLQRLATALQFELSVMPGQPTKPPGASLVYKSPFTLEELDRMGSRRVEVLPEIKGVLEDPRLSFEQRKRIAETLVTMAQWLRDRELGSDKDG